MHYLSNICILCLAHNQTLKNILSEDIDEIVVLQKINVFLNELVNFKPDVPKYVCSSCLENLNYIYKFKQTCLRNMTALNDYLLKMEVNGPCKITKHERNLQVEHENLRLNETIKNEIENDAQQCNILQKNVLKDNTEATKCPIQKNIVNSNIEYTEINASEEVFIKTEIEDIIVESDDSYLSFNEDTQEKSRQDNVVKEEREDNCQTNYDDFQEFNEEKFIVEDAESSNNCEGNEGDSTVATLDSLPSKSKERYESVYAFFENWCEQKKFEEINEDVVLAYFIEKSKHLKSSTLWSQYSMLKSTIMLNKNIDIKFPKVQAFLKKQAVGYKATKSKVFDEQHIEKFLLDADDDDFLLAKVALIMGLAGACHRDELCKITIDNIEDRTTILVVKIPDSKSDIGRTFIVVGDHNLALYKKYVALRPEFTPHQRLFVYYRNGKCSRQPAGLHTFGKIPKRIAAFLKLPNPDHYTGHCFKSTAAWMVNDRKRKYRGSESTCWVNAKPRKIRPK